MGIHAVDACTSGSSSAYLGFIDTRSSWLAIGLKPQQPGFKGYKCCVEHKPYLACSSVAAGGTAVVLAAAGLSAAH